MTAPLETMQPGSVVLRLQPEHGKPYDVVLGVGQVVTVKYGRRRAINVGVVGVAGATDAFVLVEEDT